MAERDTSNRRSKHSIVRRALNIGVEHNVEHDKNARVDDVFCDSIQISIGFLSVKRLKVEFSDGPRHMKSGTDPLAGET